MHTKPLDSLTLRMPLTGVVDVEPLSTKVLVGVELLAIVTTGTVSAGTKAMVGGTCTPAVIGVN